MTLTLDQLDKAKVTPSHSGKLYRVEPPGEDAQFLTLDEVKKVFDTGTRDRIEQDARLELRKKFPYLSPNDPDAIGFITDRINNALTHANRADVYLREHSNLGTPNNDFNDNEIDDEVEVNAIRATYGKEGEPNIHLGDLMTEGGKYYAPPGKLHPTFVKSPDSESGIEFADDADTTNFNTDVRANIAQVKDDGHGYVDPVTGNIEGGRDSKTSPQDFIGWFPGVENIEVREDPDGTRHRDIAWWSPENEPIDYLMDSILPATAARWTQGLIQGDTGSSNRLTNPGMRGGGRGWTNPGARLHDAIRGLIGKGRDPFIRKGNPFAAGHTPSDLVDPEQTVIVDKEGNIREKAAADTENKLLKDHVSELEAGEPKEKKKTKRFWDRWKKVEPHKFPTSTPTPDSTFAPKYSGVSNPDRFHSTASGKWSGSGVERAEKALKRLDAIRNPEKPIGPPDPGFQAAADKARPVIQEAILGEEATVAQEKTTARRAADWEKLDTHLHEKYPISRSSMIESLPSRNDLHAAVDEWGKANNLSKADIDAHKLAADDMLGSDWEARIERVRADKLNKGYKPLVEALRHPSVEGWTPEKLDIERTRAIKPRAEGGLGWNPDTFDEAMAEAGDMNEKARKAPKASTPTPATPANPSTHAEIKARGPSGRLRGRGPGLRSVKTGSWGKALGGAGLGATTVDAFGHTLDDNPGQAAKSIIHGLDVTGLPALMNLGGKQYTNPETGEVTGLWPYKSLTEHLFEGDAWSTEKDREAALNAYVNEQASADMRNEDRKLREFWRGMGDTMRSTVRDVRGGRPGSEEQAIFDNIAGMWKDMYNPDNPPLPEIHGEYPRLPRWSPSPVTEDITNQLWSRRNEDGSISFGPRATDSELESFIRGDRTPPPPRMSDEEVHEGINKLLHNMDNLLRSP